MGDEQRVLPDPARALPLAYAAPDTPRRRIDYASTSLVFALGGAFSFCAIVSVRPTFPYAVMAFAALLCIPLALVFGVLGLRRSERKGRAVGGIVVSAGFGCVLLILPTMGRAREPAKRIMCASNLRQIGYGIQLYANENYGLLPPSFGAILLTQDLTSDVFVCPSTDHDRATGPTTRAVVGNLSPGKTLSYIYLYPGPGQRLDQLPARTVLAYEVPANHDHTPRDGGANFLFADGSVDYVINAQTIIEQLKAGQNPPAPPTPAP